MKKFPVSFSRMSCFENCPQQFDYLYVSKVVKDLGNTHTEYGTRVHEALEKIAKVGTDPVERAKLELEGIPLEVREHVRLVDRLLAKPGRKFFEYQMTVDSNRQPCDWFGDDVWVRSIADVLIVDGTTAYVIDWKTGKPKDNPTQMQLFACMAMIHFPEVQDVKTSFVWLNHNHATNASYPRSMFDLLWSGIERRLNNLQETVDLGVFKAKPSGLCKWCAAKKVCAYAK